MFSSISRPTRVREALCATAIALLAALPTASAVADSAAAARAGAAQTQGVSAAVTAPGELLAPAQLEELLAQLPLSDLSTAQLAHYLAELEDIEALAQLHVELGLQELGLPRLEEGLAEGIQQLGAGATLGELADPQQLLPALETQLDGLLTTLLGPALGAEQTQQLSEALEKVSLPQLVAALLETAKEPSQLSGLAQLADGLLEKLEPAALTGLLGGGALEGPFSPTTVEEAAKELGTTSEALSGELGQSAATLPATATMLTAPVGGGKLLAVAPAVKGLAVGLLGGLPGEEGGEGGSGGGKGGSGSGEGKGSGLGQGGGGQGGTSQSAGGQGASAGGTTLIVNIPASGSSAAAPVNAAKAKAPSAKVAILSHRVHGSAVTVVLRVPAAGRVTLSGAGVRGRTFTARRAGKLTVTLRLTRAGTAARHRHHGRLAVRVRAAFVSTAGARSSAAATATFR